MSSEPDRRLMRKVEECFEALRGDAGDKLGELMRLLGDLNYRPVQEPIPVSGWTKAAREAVAGDALDGPMILSEAGGGGDLFSEGEDAFRVVYCPIKQGKTKAIPLRLTDERAVVGRIFREDGFPECLFVFSDPQQEHWHFVNPRRLRREQGEREDRRERYVLRRMSVGPDEKLRTAFERFALIRLSNEEAISASSRDIQEKHDDAFNVEKVTKKFFEGFKRQFFELEDALGGQVDDEAWAGEYAVRLLSRIMFVYFVQRKRWVDEDPNFMSNFWQRYIEATDGDDTFFEQWLEPLFFEAFADPGRAAGALKREYMPEETREALRTAPYLNGGLFARERLDTKYAGEFSVPDRVFEDLLDTRNGFFERYNFTISEDSPLDQEVAVDPEMIGRVYESLVNMTEPGSEAAEDREKQRQAGIFYTPRTEIHLMCRLALSDYLRKHLGDAHRDVLYEMMFAIEPDEKATADEHVMEENLWGPIHELLHEVRVVDPACGSGSFLVGMLGILTDLQRRAKQALGFGWDTTLDRYRTMESIIGANLYGVDVMEWAVKVAELRLWLQLIVEAELKAEERVLQPLLPNLSFKIRTGDSLVQEIAGIDVSHIRGHAGLSPALKSRLTTLMKDRREYFRGEAEGTSEQQLRNEEGRLFRDLLRAHHNSLSKSIHEKSRQVRDLDTRLVDAEMSQKELGLKGDLEEAIRDLQDRAGRVQAVLEAISIKQNGERVDVPLVWDMAFPEIFTEDNAGFDIVVGNPPYVRQEKIADPAVPFEDQSREDRKAYKRKLAESAYALYPQYFQAGSGGSRPRIGARSDLYLYFYLHALSLLNSEGTFCFVTSNSWLDVGYGKSLQEFLARQVPMHMIIDNEAKRSFSQADVNTIIALFGAPRENLGAAVDNTVRYVMAQTDFERLLHPVIFMEIDDATEGGSWPELRVRPMEQSELLEGGIDPDHADRVDDDGLPVIGSYTGDKWGGKYLRAPDIYWEILEKAGDRLVRLGEIAEVRFGIKTGCNEFFYLPSKHFGIEPDGDYYNLMPKGQGLPSDLRIEKEFVRPVIKSSRECAGIRIQEEELSLKLLMCSVSPEDVRSMAVWDYIEWGEEQGFHEGPTCASRTDWWNLGDREHPPVVAPASVSDIVRTFANPGVYVDKRLYEVYPEVDARQVLLSTNSTFCSLFLEVGSRTGLGQGLLDLTVYEWAACPIVVPELTAEARAALKVAEGRVIHGLEQELDTPNRRQLDEVVCAALNLPQSVLGAVHEALRDLVQARLGKAQSV